MKENNAGPWYLLTGLVLGALIGLLYAWWIAPLPLQGNADPASLRADFKDEYRLLIASAYAANGNLSRAQARLNLLSEEPGPALSAQTQRWQQNGAQPAAWQPLELLAQALQAAETPSLSAADSTSLPAALPGSPPPTLDESALVPPITQVFPSPTLRRVLPPARLATPLARPSPQPSFTPGAPFALLDQVTFCDPQRPAWLEVILLNAEGEPAAAIPLNISWPGGEETFFSGLKPEIGGNGYADFVMSPQVEYTLTLSQGAVRVSGLQAQPCQPASGDSFLGGIHLEFQQP